MYVYLYNKQEEDQEGSAVNSDSDAEFEQMLAEAEEPKPPSVAGTEESAQPKEEDPAVLSFSSILYCNFFIIYTKIIVMLY